MGAWYEQYPTERQVNPPSGDARKAVNAFAPRLLPRGPGAAALGGALRRTYVPAAAGAAWDELRKLWE